MSYTETTWARGDAITADKLNNIEGGIKANETAISQIDTSGGSVELPIIIVSATKDYDEEGYPTGDYILDKTYIEISNAFYQGKLICLWDSLDKRMLMATKASSGGIVFSAVTDLTDTSNSEHGRGNVFTLSYATLTSQNVFTIKRRLFYGVQASS